jgi:hypothetical protein
MTQLLLLLQLRLRLIARVVQGGAGRQVGRWPLLFLFVLAGVLLMTGLSVAPAAFMAVSEHGAGGLLAAIGLIHLGWLVMAMLMTSLSEALDLRRMLRYPVSPRLVYLFNIAATPIDLPALVFVPSLMACVLAAGLRMGPLAGAGTALAVSFIALYTGALLQLANTAFERFLRHEWVRAIAGLLLALFFVAPQMMGRVRAHAADLVELGVGIGASLRWVPTVSLPALIAQGAMTGDPLQLAAGTAGAAILLYLIAALGAAFAVQVARAPEPVARVRARVGAAPARSRTLDTRVPGQIATLLGRELRYLARNPALIVNLGLLPVYLYFFVVARPLGRTGGEYFAVFWVIQIVSTYALNQFGFDRGGVRQFFMLPVSTRRVVVAKNLLISLVTVVTAGLAALTLALLRQPLSSAQSIRAGLILLLCLPLNLISGNISSVRVALPMRASFGPARRGRGWANVGRSLGVMLGQVVAVAVPLVLAIIAPPERRFMVGAIGLGLETVAAWAWWWSTLDRAARRLSDERESLLTALASANEEG